MVDADKYTRWDWLEDRELENGGYQNVCVHCNHVFIGHKRRVVCRVCVGPENPHLQQLTTVINVPTAKKPYPDE